MEFYGGCGSRWMLSLPSLGGYKPHAPLKRRTARAELLVRNSGDAVGTIAHELGCKLVQTETRQKHAATNAASKDLCKIVLTHPNLSFAKILAVHGISDLG